MRSVILALMLTAMAVGAGCELVDWPSSDNDADGGQERRGQEAIVRYGCGSCHTIPGVRGAIALVGPSLEHMARRTYIAGVLPNTNRNMISWLIDPPNVDDKTAMPNLNVSAGDAEDIATYLGTLR